MMEKLGSYPYQEIMQLQRIVIPSPGTGLYGSLEDLVQIKWPIPMMGLLGLRPVQELLYLQMFVSQSPVAALFPMSAPPSSLPF
jgi:hypothetical protein